MITERQTTSLLAVALFCTVLLIFPTSHIFAQPDDKTSSDDMSDEAGFTPDEAVEPGRTGEIVKPDLGETSEERSEKETTEGVIVEGGDISIVPSVTGRAEIQAVLKNASDIPVDGIRLDVVLFHVERRRAADLAIPFTSGKVSPSRLEPGEKGEILYETDFQPEEIAGYRYRVVWNVYNKILKKKTPQPPSTDQ